LCGLIRPSRTPATRAPPASTPREWRLMIASALLYAIAFNVTFFVQELFLVLPKAFTPGLRPTLYHNNHTWEGEHALASLFQGTGALAILLSAIACAFLLRRRPQRSANSQLFLVWMTYCGFFQALPQIVIGAIYPQNDVGMAMEYLQLGTTAKTVAALIALAAMPLIALRLTRALLGFAEDTAQIASGRARRRFICYSATLPALIALPLIFLFRVPRELVEVVVGPVIVTVIGIAWMQAGAWLEGSVEPHGAVPGRSIAYPFAALVVLLALFQLVLRPGIPFY
jgi:hypothetical protein